MVERHVYTVDVVGSSPAGPTLEIAGQKPVFAKAMPSIPFDKYSRVGVVLVLDEPLSYVVDANRILLGRTLAQIVGLAPGFRWSVRLNELRAVSRRDRALQDQRCCSDRG